MPSKALFNRIKGILKRVPGVRTLLRLKGKITDKIMRIRELSDLIKENRIVIFPSYSRFGNDVALTREMVHEVVKEWLDLYGIAHIRRTTAAAINSPAGSILLYAPQALLRIPSSHEEYLKRVEREKRREIRIAERQGYEFKEFVWNDHLDEIYEINTSKEVRLGEPMRGWYREPVQPRHHSKEELQYRKYYGAFKEGKLWAYLHYWICGDFAIIKHIIGHAQHLKYGIMNGLISYTVRECIGNSQIRWLHYGRYTGEFSLNTFKKHAGFQKYAFLFDLEGDQELLKYSEHTVKTWWRV
jgi:hypothetical protein